jgi:hypothetical protein
MDESKDKKEEEKIYKETDILIVPLDKIKGYIPGKD